MPKYTRKTVDEFDLMIDYGQGYECVLTESTMKEAKARKKEYLDNDMYLIRIYIKKHRVLKDTNK